MIDYVTLLGADDIRSAGYVIREAAQTMSHAASEIESALRRHQDFLDDWLCRFESAMQPEQAKEQG